MHVHPYSYLISVRCSQVNGGNLPPHVLPYCAVGAAAAAVLSIATFLLQRASQQLSELPATELSASAERWRSRRAAIVAAAEWAIPSGIGVAVGMCACPKAGLC